jgi:hypothetical protein
VICCCCSHDFFRVRFWFGALSFSPTHSSISLSLWCVGPWCKPVPFDFGSCAVTLPLQLFVFLRCIFYPFIFRSSRSFISLLFSLRDSFVCFEPLVSLHIFDKPSTLWFNSALYFLSLHISYIPSMFHIWASKWFFKWKNFELQSCWSWGKLQFSYKIYLRRSILKMYWKGLRRVQMTLGNATVPTDKWSPSGHFEWRYMYRFAKHWRDNFCKFVKIKIKISPNETLSSEICLTAQ